MIVRFAKGDRGEHVHRTNSNVKVEVFLGISKILVVEIILLKLGQTAVRNVLTWEQSVQLPVTGAHPTELLQQNRNQF